MAYTTPDTAVTGVVAPAAMWNTGVRDNLETAVMTCRVRKSSDESDATSVLQNDNDLLLALAANEIWQFRVNLLVVAASTTDFKCRFTFPSGSISGTGLCASGGVVNVQELSAAASPSTQFNVNTAGTISERVVLEGVVSNGGSAGNLQLQWSGQAAVAAVVKANSTLWAAKLA